MKKLGVCHSEPFACHPFALVRAGTRPAPTVESVILNSSPALRARNDPDLVKSLWSAPAREDMLNFFGWWGGNFSRSGRDGIL
jgi:hypothetical protein